MKLKRNIENYKSKVENNNYNSITATTIDVNIFLTQNLDDQGIFTDQPFTPLLPYLTERPTYLGNFNSFVYGRFPAAPLSFYINKSDRVEGTSDDSNLPNVSSYRVNQNTGEPIYVNNLDMSGKLDLVFTGVLSQDSESMTYVLNADKNNISDTGVHFVTFLNDYINTEDEDGNIIRYRKTDFHSDLQSINENNVSLSAITKQEEYFGLVFKPEVESEVFIDRGVSDIFERHALLGEIKTTNDIDNNRGGFLRT